MRACDNPGVFSHSKIGTQASPEEAFVAWLPVWSKAKSTLGLKLPDKLSNSLQIPVLPKVYFPTSRVYLTSLSVVTLLLVTSSGNEFCNTMELEAQCGWGFMVLNQEFPWIGNMQNTFLNSANILKSLHHTESENQGDPADHFWNKKNKWQYFLGIS